MSKVHFLQSEAWAGFQRALGHKVFAKAGRGWSYMAVLETGRGNTRLYCPYGPVCTNDDAFEEAILSLKDLGREQGATFLRIEPTGSVTKKAVQKMGCKEVLYNQLQPAQTQIITLANKTEDEILAGMQSNNRNLYRAYAKKGLAMRESSDSADVAIFLRFIHKVAGRTGLRPHSDEYFKKQAASLFRTGAAKLFYAEYEGRPIAASIVYDDETTRYYAHAAADDDFRKLSAGTALVTYMIIDAMKSGKKEFDLFGIAPKSPEEDPRHAWAGFTKFKQRFGGERREYVGTWDIPLRPGKYYGYKAYQTLNNIRRNRRK
ncbi:peptidoglycan bridge formation glycyltransferase FemA/FemB family protein [Candidatus Saccharibacteria bacterium]|nr:peptidoglycan bridge formation glycyltransferase FemA/FemB family protein [Candidatus Saccharibacteria bacterium]